MSIVILILLTAASCSNQDSQTRQDPEAGTRARPAATASEPVSADRGKPHVYEQVLACCIGINNYQSDGIRQLSQAEGDAQRMAELFAKRFGYRTECLLGSQATRQAILGKVDEYKARLGENDALILYFAGHGELVERQFYGRDGYLVPYDASLSLDDKSDPQEWAEEAIRMTHFVKLLNRLPALHVVIIVDCCCSGYMTQRGTLAERADLTELLQLPSRTVIASTTAQGSAQDGLFAEEWIKQLDRNGSQSLSDVFLPVRRIVQSRNRKMIPQLAPVGGDGGEFVFIPLVEDEESIRLAMKEVVQRAREKIRQRTTVDQIITAFECLDYRYTTRRDEAHQQWQQILERFLRNASEGDALAMAGAHYCFSKGLGTDKSPERALEFAQLAFDTGQPVGSHVLGRCYLVGDGVETNEIAAWKLFADAAEQGFPISKYSLGNRLLMSDLADERGHQLLEEAAAAGVTNAQVAVAEILAQTDPSIDWEKNPTLQRDIPRAIEWLNKAIEGKSPSGMLRMADLLSRGTPGFPPRDLPRAVELFERAAQLGHSQAQLGLANEYVDFSQDRQLGDQVLRATQQFGLKPDFQLARQWFDLAAQQGRPEAMLMLCEIYENGDGVNIDFEEARRYCEQAAALNYPRAWVKQAVWYDEGVIYKRNVTESRDLLRRAAQANDALGAALFAGYLWEMHDVDPPTEPSDPDKADATKYVLQYSADHPAIVRYRRDYTHHSVHYYLFALQRGRSDGFAEMRLKVFVDDCRAWARKYQQPLPRDWTGISELGPLVVLKKLAAQYPESVEPLRKRFEAAGVRWGEP